MPQTTPPKPSHACAAPSQQLDNSGIFCIGKSRRARSPVTIDAPVPALRIPQVSPSYAAAERHHLETVRCGAACRDRWLLIIDAVVNRDFCTACGFAASRECKCLSANEGFDVDDDL